MIFSKRFIVTALFAGIVLVGLSRNGFGQQTVPAVPEYIPPVSFSDALKGLGDGSIKSLFDRNSELSKAIDDHGVGFAFNGNARDVLTKAGASEGLFTAISRGQKKRADEIIRLMDLFRESFHATDISGRQETVAAGRELRDRIGDPDLLVGDEKELREFANYLKTAVPQLEANLQRKLKLQTDH